MSEPTRPYYADSTITLHHGDCLAVLRSLPDASIDAVVTDPPYGLANTDPAHVAETITRWVNGERDYLPGGAGFMGKAWDAFVPPVAVWDDCLRVLKPGGHVLAFAGSRTVDLMTLGLRLAGFDIRDSIAWLYGSGFPKSLDVSKAIDKAARGVPQGGLDPTSLNHGRYRTTTTEGKRWDGDSGQSYGAGGSRFLADGMASGSATDPAASGVVGAAADWQGWGTAMKPAHEPVVCARKPFNAVSLDWRLVANVHHALAGLLWLSLSPAKRAKLSSPSNRAERDAAWCASALVSVATDTSRAGYDETVTFSSPATASTSSSIASSWSAILAALSDPTRTSTTSTASSTTTALRTLNSLLAPITSQTTMPPCGCLLGGSALTAASAESSSTDEWASWLHTLSASAPESAIEGIAVAAASVCAQVAESLSVDLGVGSSAAPTATTGAASSSSPAFEPIVVARKPLSGTVAANVLAHGTGALNIAGCRIGDEVRHAAYTSLAPAHGNRLGAEGTQEARRGTQGDPKEYTGRWPANVILDESQAAVLDAQGGASQSRVGKPRGADAGDGWGMTATGAEYDDEGGASRFFYVAKADASERVRVNGTAHPTVKPLALMRWLVRLVTPPGGVVLEPFAGSGTTVEACILEGFPCVAIEREADYLPLIVQRVNRRRDPVAAVKGSGGDGGLFDLLGEGA